MIKTLIIEDEWNARESLKKMLHLLDTEIEVIAETGYISEAQSLLNEQEVDLIFLDIRLEDGSGLDLLKQFKNQKFKVIFITAYDQYAISAFKFSATDYLLKPVDPVELQEAIHKATSKIAHDRLHQELLEILKNNLANENQTIVIKTLEEQHILALDKIIRLEADTAYTIFITPELRIVASKNLRYYQELLGEHFIRCHQSHLVNQQHIKSLYKGKFLKMSNDELVPISTRKRAEIIALIKK